ncbi:WxL domain-containing protein [Enterococcus sp. AZ062]|uniref:WxL domain-containing protein n=1 Tax=Enterococcus sp. AZ062 TaxID=2774692 RepID=UPI003F247D84
MTMTWRKTQVFLSTTLVVLHVLFLPVSMIYAEMVEAPIHETEEDLEPLELPSIKNYLEKGETSEPRFFFTQSRMQGMIEEPIKVIFFSDQEVSEARVTLPNEAKLLKEQLPVGLTAKQGTHSHEWIIQTERVRNTFVLPVIFDSVGNYEVAVKDATATIEVQEPEETSEEVPVEETESSDEDSAGQEDLKEEENVIEEDQENEQPAEEVREPVVEAPQEQQIDAEETDEAIEEPTVFDGETEEVTTMAQFRAAVANPNIGIISVQANLTEATANVLTVDRPLLIQGNGYTLTFGINGFYFQLAEVVEPSVFRIENTRLTKVGTTPLINATVESSKNWTVELENITEVNANTMRLASLPEGNIHFTGGVSNFTRTASAQTFIVAKEVVATNQAEVTISRGNATVLFSSATVADPKMTVEQGATVTITTTAGNANTIDLRGENPEIAVQNGHLSVGTIGPATATTPTNTTNNTIVLSGVSPKFSLDQESTFSLRTTLSKRGIYLVGNNSQLTANNSEFSVTSETAEAIQSEGQNGILTIANSNMNLTTTAGRAMRVNGQINILRSNLSTNSTMGLPISTDNANGEIVIDESQLNLTMSSSNNGIRLSGTDSLLKISNNSEVKLTSGSGTARNILFSGARSKMIIENQSKLILNASGPTSDATDSANNAIQFVGESSELTVRNQSILDVNVIAGAKRGVFFQNSSNKFNIDEESEAKINTEQANSLHMQGSNQKTTISGKSSLILKSNWNVHGSTNEHNQRSSLYIGMNGASNSIIEVDEQSSILTESNLSSSIVLEGRVNSFYVKNKSEINLYSGSTTSISTGAFATLRFLNSGDSLFKIENSMFSILKSGGSAPGIRMLGDKNSIEVVDGGIFQVKNPGNGTPSDGNTQGGNQGVHLTSGNDTSFSVTDPGSQVTILAENGPAIDLSGMGKVKNSNGGYFEAVGRTATASGGIFRAGVLDVEFDNPLFMDFRNNRSGGGNLFNVASGSSLKALNSDLAVWKNGSNLDGDPDLNFPTLDFSFSGINFNTLGATSQPDVLNTGTFGTTGLTTYSRLSSNNARWAIADELRVPTNADKKIHGHVSIPVGLEESRSAWDGEATVIVEVERADGRKTEHNAKTVGHSNEEPGISIYGEEPRAGLFEVELEEYLQKGDKVKIKDVRLTSGELTQGYENIILTDTVEVFPIIPPTPAKFSSSVVSNDSTAIKGFTENKEVTVTATHNNEPINTENVVVENDGTFTLDLSELSLQGDDEIQVFLKDFEGSAAVAGVVNPPATNDEQGNINPKSPLSFRDKLFDEATVLTVQDLRPVSPVDPLAPETEIDPENKPQLPEDQGRLSIDFVSQLQFGTQGISVTDQTYYAQPQRLLNEDGTVNKTEERPNYVQISDRRPENDRNGWQLAVTQNAQFTATNNRELNGARLRLTNQQLATAQGGSAPEFQQTNPLALVPENRRILLMAQGTVGTGTWIYRLGDQETANKSVALDVPKGANPESARYETTLTWELSAVPDN